MVKLASTFVFIPILTLATSLGWSQRPLRHLTLV